MASAPFPSLPAEIIGEIISHCDPPTLAAVARVSSAFLQFSARPLYQDIVLKDAQAFELFIGRLQHLTVDRPTLFKHICTHQSRTRIHSITITAFQLDNELLKLDEHFPADWTTSIRIPVVVVSIPTLNSAALDFGFLQWIKPTTLLLQGPLRPSPDVLPGDEDSDHWPEINLSRAFLTHFPSTIITSQVHIEYEPFLHKHALKQVLPTSNPLTDSQAPPIRFFIDFLDAPPDREIYTADTFAEMYKIINDEMRNGRSSPLGGLLAVPRFEVRGWMTDEKARKEAVKDLEEPRWGVKSHIGRTVEPLVASDRLRRFREEMLKGVEKGLDWGVLEEIRPLL